MPEKETYAVLTSSEPICGYDDMYCKWSDVPFFIEGVLDAADLGKEVTFKVTLHEMTAEEWEKFMADNGVEDDQEGEP